MSLAVQNRMVNPRLGAYFGIFASLFAALFVLALIASELGVSDRVLRFAALLGPVALYVALGMASATSIPREFFASGRRVPAVYSGVVMAAATLGGVSVVSLTGLFFGHGFDVWAIVSGGAAGLVLMGVLIAPYYRKFGAYTVPSYLGRRYASRFVRLVAAMVLIVPIFLFLVAELRIGFAVARQLTGSNERWMLALILGVIGISLGLGGMRAASWTGTAQGIAMIIAVIVGIGTVGVVFTNLPIVQLSYGPTLRVVSEAEAALGLTAATSDPMTFKLAGEAMVRFASPVAEPFTSIGPASYVLTVLTMMGGVACAPWLLPRTTTTPGVHAARKSASWAVLVYAAVMITVAAAAVFFRDVMLTSVVGQTADTAPAWFQSLLKNGLATLTTTSSPAAAGIADVGVHRDVVLFSLPEAAGAPAALTYLLYAGGVAAVLAAAIASAQAMGAVLTEDVVLGLTWEPPGAFTRLIVARVALTGVFVLAAATAMLLQTDPLVLMLWALGLSASTAFPVVALSIWYKRMGATAAVAALVCGFGVSTTAILLGEVELFGVPRALAAGFGLPVAVAVAFVVTALTGRPSRVALEHVRDMRIPGGETIYDREMRLMRLKSSAPV